MRGFIASGCVAVMVALAGSAQGQDAPSRPPLQGPTVPQNRPPHVDDQFGEGMKGGKGGNREAMIPMRAYADVIGKLRGENAVEGLRLSADQDQKVGAIEQEFREATKAYAQQMKQERGNDSMAPSSEGGKKGEGRPRREMAQEMMKNGPKPGDYQTRVWAVLNEKQQAFVKVELDKVREELQKKRGEEMMQRRINERRGVKGEMPEAQKPAPENGPPVRERAQRIMRRMAQLPAEDRERILKRLEEELDKRGIPNDPPPPPKND